MTKSDKIINIIVAVAFVIVIFLFSAFNIKPLFNAIANTFPNTETRMQEKTRNIEQTFTESLICRNHIIDIYGAIQKIFGNSLIGNFEFMKSDNDFMHMAVNSLDTTPFVSSISTLQKLLNQTNTPLVYVQVPPRSIVNTEKDAMNISYAENMAIHEAKNEILAQGITYLDIEEKLSEYSFSPEEFYFKTDVHLTTKGEFFLAKEIVETLQENEVSLNEEDIDRIFNISNYNIESYQFLGNLSRSTGKYYSQMDVFDNYTPKYQTSFSMNNKITGQQRMGLFEDVFMNNYKSSPGITERIYWVTNYLYYGQAFYEFTNHTQDNHKLLVVCDSMGMRAVPLLALLVNKVTVVDIRFQGDNSYVLDALDSEKYDAVIVLQEQSLFNSKIVQ